MSCRLVIIIITSFLLLFLLDSFLPENSYFQITGKDVRLNYPSSFPKPVYDFRKNKITPEGFRLGRKLFYDPVLSKDNSVSCASCHQRFAAFAHIDHPLSHGINGIIGKRNVPAIQNLAWDNSFMWDGGVSHMEMQPLAPITGKSEMGEELQNVISKLQNDPEYVALFSNAFHDRTITSEKMLKALCQFMSLIVSGNSRYDKYIAGTEKFSDEELNGLKLFRSKCANCHKEPLFTDNSFRNIGLAPDTSIKDYGRIAITGDTSDYMKFKVPSLRNVEITYPYMHDGRFKSLNKVLEYYSNGNFVTANYDLSIVRASGLTETEKTGIIAFLKTLTDRSFTYDKRFMDPSAGIRN